MAIKCAIQSTWERELIQLKEKTIETITVISQSGYVHREMGLWKRVFQSSFYSFVGSELRPICHDFSSETKGHFYEKSGSVFKKGKPY